MKREALKSSNYAKVLVDPVEGDWSCAHCWVPVNDSMKTCPECKRILIKPSSKPTRSDDQEKAATPNHPKRGARLPTKGAPGIPVEKPKSVASPPQAPKLAQSPPTELTPLLPEVKVLTSIPANGCSNCIKMGGTIFWRQYAVPPCSLACPLISKKRGRQ